MPREEPSLALFDGGLFLLPLVPLIVLVIVSPVAIGAMGLLVGDALRNALGVRAGVVLSITALALVAGGLAAIWLADGTPGGALVIAFIVLPILAPFFAASLNAASWLRWTTMALGWAETAALVLYANSIRPG